MKLESLVIANQHVAGELRSRALYTPPVTPRELITPEAGGLTARKELSKVGLMIGVKS